MLEVSEYLISNCVVVIVTKMCDDSKDKQANKQTEADMQTNGTEWRAWK